jgi:hypothetical protein
LECKRKKAEGRGIPGTRIPTARRADDLSPSPRSSFNVCGYHRRDEELPDAKCAILGS